VTGEVPDRLFDVVRLQLAAQCRWARLSANQVRVTDSIFEAFCTESLDGAATLPYCGLSSINADGLPFQWSQCFGLGPRTVRFVCEIGRQHTTVDERYVLSLARLTKVRQMLDFPLARWFDSEILMLLKSNDSFPAHWRSAIWIGVGILNSGVVIKPYFNLNCGQPVDRWKTVGCILREIAHPDCLTKLCELSRHVSRDSWPVGLTVDLCKSNEPTRMKIYFRSGKVNLSWLENWYRATGYSFHSSAIRSLLDSFPCEGVKVFPEGAFVVALEFHLQSGLVSIKTDIALNKLGYERANAAEGVRRVVAETARESSGIESWFKSLNIESNGVQVSPLRFVGIGSEPDHTLHVNVYTEPIIELPLPCKALTRNSRLRKMPNRRQAIERSLRFLINQAKDEHWTDFHLPIGESDAWVTAYVLYRLVDVPSCLITPEARRLICDALTWLKSAQSACGAWGYHRHIEADADSTSLALLALQLHGQVVPKSAIRFLLSCMNSDGTFSTYPVGSGLGVGWESAHHEVSCTALLALKGHMPPGTWDKMIRFVRQAKLSRRGTAPYWWLTPLYCDAIQTSLFESQGAVIQSIEPENKAPGRVAFSSFEIALSLLSMSADNSMCVLHRELFARLLEQQEHDGSWCASAWLRLVNPGCLKPTERIDSGSLHVDKRAIFTTSTALSALSRGYEGLTEFQ
jgi:hypothetical protein